MKLSWLHDLLGHVTSRLAGATRIRSVAADDADRERLLGTPKQQWDTVRNGQTFAKQVNANATAVLKDDSRL